MRFVGESKRSKASELDIVQCPPERTDTHLQGDTDKYQGGVCSIYAIERHDVKYL